MTPERIEQECKAFEKWYASTYLPTPVHGRTFNKYPTGVYCLQHVQDAWQAWQAQATQSEWISVEERLPEAHDDILVYTCDGDIYPILAICRDITWIGISGATHWQPLPEPPETRGK